MCVWKKRKKLNLVQKQCKYWEWQERHQHFPSEPRPNNKWNCQHQNYHPGTRSDSFVVLIEWWCWAQTLTNSTIQWNVETETTTTASAVADIITSTCWEMVEVSERKFCKIILLYFKNFPSIVVVFDGTVRLMFAQKRDMRRKPKRRRWSLALRQIWSVKTLSSLDFNFTFQPKKLLLLFLPAAPSTQSSEFTFMWCQDESSRAWNDL